MPYFKCIEHKIEFNSVQATIEHIRRFHGQYGKLRSPGGLGEYDSHKKLWYCFECCVPKNYKGRRRYDSDRAMWHHLVDFHRSAVSMIQSEVDLKLSEVLHSTVVCGAVWPRAKVPRAKGAKGAKGRKHVSFR